MGPGSKETKKYKKHGFMYMAVVNDENPHLQSTKKHKHTGIEKNSLQ